MQAPLNLRQMNHKNNKRVIIVLGMHRSGTSAITRGLQALDVNLGNNLIPPAPGNKKGHYEDAEINKLNIELLDALKSEWHSLSPIPDAAFDQETITPIKLRALELLRYKISEHPFGFKDPRIARLLPFWHSVFKTLRIQPSYVICIRHPMSVAQSLKRRDGFDTQKSYFLWMQHIIPSILKTTGTYRVVVDFDILLTDPNVQLHRIAQALNLPINSESAKLKAYTDEFLDIELRHAKFEFKDLRKDPEIPHDVIDAFRLMNRLARDEINIDDPAVEKKFRQISVRLKMLSQALACWARSDVNLAERESQIVNLRGQIVNLQGRIVNLQGQIVNFNQSIEEHEGQITSLKQSMAELRKSTSWRITAPVRCVGHQVGRIKNALSYATAMCGGYTGLLRHVWKIYKRGGMHGIKRRIDFTLSLGTPQPVKDELGRWVDKNDYTGWICRYDTLTDTDREIIKARVKLFPRLPLISVVMPVYNPPVGLLKEAVESVRGQLYPNWELCIADDASTDKDVYELLRFYVDNDFRIKVVFRDSNGHISAASNSALEIASGEYIALLDNDDLLPEHALFYVAEAIITNPDAAIIYSDEDKISMSGVRINPYFKCDWNPELFLGQNLISHLGVYRTDIVKAIGGFRVGYEGSQDYDLAARVIEQIMPSQIIHIPRILYHWRIYPGSTSMGNGEKPYAIVASERAMNDHLYRRGVKGIVKALPVGSHRLRFDLPEDPPLVSIIIQTRNAVSHIRKCVTSIFNLTSYEKFEILLIDNGSDDPAALRYFNYLQRNYKNLTVIKDDRLFNFSALNNGAVQQSRGKIIALLHHDTEVITTSWLDEMVSIALQPGVGAVGARLWYYNNTLEHGGLITGLSGVADCAHKYLERGQFGYFGRAHLTQSISAVGGACLVIRKSIYQETGGFDERNLKVEFNDVDFCLRVREAGYRNVWTPYAELYHNESAMHGDTPDSKSSFRREVLYMKKRWGDSLVYDPAYSPNLTLNRTDFSLAWPPRVRRP
jgi:glycosyltransferase involved in cell wall biosynthesis